MCSRRSRPVGFSTTIKIISQLYAPTIKDQKIIYAYEPTGTHQRFVKENYTDVVNYLSKKKEKKYEWCETLWASC